jgi:DNA polymerase type B, organellar and viral
LREALLIFDKFKININSSPTLPSLAFKIYRSHFLPKVENIHSLAGSVYKAISQGYKGGAVDMYITKNPTGKKIWAYDVNSLYPFVMKNSLYPIGPATYFKGDIFNVDKYAFGFLFVTFWLIASGFLFLFL